MFLNLPNLFFVLTFTLVIANPVMQRLPVQQISFQNLQKELPVAVNQPTTGLYSFSPHVQGTPSIHSYQSASSYDPNNLIVEKILANPTLKAILNPSVYAQKGIDRNQQNLVLKSTETPTIVNNYIIIPAEYLKFNETRIVQDKQDENISKEPKQKGRKSKVPNTKRHKNRELVDTKENINVDQDTIESQKPNSRLERHEKAINELSGVNSDTSLTLETKNTPSSLSIEGTSIKNLETFENDSSANESNVTALVTTVKTNKTKRKRNRSKNKNIVSSAQNSTQRVLEHDNFSFPITENIVVDNGLNHSKINQRVEFINQSVVNSLLDKREHKSNRTSNQNSNRGNVNTTLYGHKYAENRLPKNLNEVTIIQNLRKKYPGVPEEVIRNLMFLIKQQLQITPNNFFYPQYNFPFDYNELYRSLPFTYFNGIDSTQASYKRKKGSRRNSQKTSKRNRTKSNKNKNPPDIDNGTLISLLDKTKVDNVTKTNTNATSEITTALHEEIELNPFKLGIENHENPKIQPLQDKGIEVIKEKFEFDSHDFGIPEIGTEDEMPNIYDNRLIEDYFPDFTVDNKAYLKRGEYSPQDIQEDRYYYTTNRNTKRSEDEIVNKHFSQINPKLSERKDDENEIITDKNRNLKSTTIYEVEFSEDSEEIRFQAPPLLEKPDFITRKIYKVPFIDYDPYGENSYQSNIDDFKPYEYSDSSTDKVSTYSDVKTPEYDIRVKPAKDIDRIKVHSENKQAKNDEIITVYAQSRVANYGQTDNNSESAADN